jgi:DNA-directed RNA polymerase subunit beta
MSTKTIKYSPLVSRRDYSQINTDFFEEPNLLEIQKNSYEKFFKEEIDQLFKLYFPIFHDRNKKHIVEYTGNKIVKPKNFLSEEEAREKGGTYEKSLYVDLKLINQETGVVEEVRKSSNNVSSGVFFGNIPMITDKGTFIINGVEKNIISQIVRAPGLYVLTKSKIRLNNKKSEKKGYICELLPSRGTLINFYTHGNGNKATIKCAIRNSQHDKAPEFGVTELLKALGLGETEINKIYKNNVLIANSLLEDRCTRKNILEDKLIRSFRADAENGKNNENQGLFTKIRKLINEYNSIPTNNNDKVNNLLDQIVTE